MVRLIWIVLMLMFSISCSKKKESSWTGALSDLESGVPIFSFIFIDQPPDGSLMRADIFDGKINSPCDLHRPDANLDEVVPFWYLSIKVGSTAPGTYEVVPFFYEEEDRDKASVFLNRVKNPKSADRYPAVSGTVELIESPTNSDEWHDGVKLTLSINAEFPETILDTGQCEGSDGENGFEGGTCECEAPDGTITTCELEDVSQETCCIDMDGPRVSFSKEITADPCAWACTWLGDQLDLGQYCQELF
ncbi:MAG: hypothetical protein QNJ97_28870 [Myxococcota bacterium]|nr:hypothetical protein [Myxococcota bacterium]